jgi:hypothetical protein
VEQAADQSGITITTPVNLVPLNQLAGHVGRKVGRWWGTQHWARLW